MREWDEEAVLSLEERMNALNLAELLVLKGKIMTMLDLLQKRELEIAVWRC